jgi:hypothetical protein
MPAGRSFRVRALAVGVAASVLTMLALGTFAGAGTTSSKSGFSTRSAIDRIKVTCTLNLIAVLPPRTPTAENFGTVQCGSPFGNGVQHDSSVVTGTPGNQLTGSFNGPFEQFFDNGKLSGHFHIDYTVNPSTRAISYVGTIDVEAGTGLYSRTRGAGTLNGGSTDAVHSTITEVLQLTRLF